jgi:UDP-2-acetamido-3-amino-2,3-dideoxy-glucuronate N-acetyltransferase
MSDKGYYTHPAALAESSRIGAGTRIWAFAHILPGASIGDGCNICDHVFIENDVIVGNRVTVKCGVQLWDGVRLEDDTFVGPNATFTNDPFPRSGRRPDAFAVTTVRAGASIGANATILPGVTIGRNAMVGAGADVMQDVPTNAIVAGCPARIVGYVDAKKRKPDVAAKYPSEEPVLTAIGVRGVRIVRPHSVADLRGHLAVGELSRDFPFSPRRYFLVYDVPSREVRGEHAHRTLHQLLTCVKGQCCLLVDDGTRREEIVLDGPTIAVYIEPMVWGVQYKFSPDAVLMVLASAEYDPDDYIRNYDEYLSALRDI